MRIIYRPALRALTTGIMLLASAAVAQAAEGLEVRFDTANPTLEVSRVDHDGGTTVRAVDKTGQGADPLIMLPVEDFHDGVIEAEVVGRPGPAAGPDMRGFVGIAFRVQNRTRYETFYIRPTNGRSDDQLRRNHSTQYSGMPDYPWHRLRKEHPGVYESYADMVAGEWTKLKIEVEGQKARLFVGDAKQPSLIVNDLKLDANARGGVALWVGNGTEAYFRNVIVTKSD